MNRLDVKEGQVVKAGQQIGLSGQTGNAKGPHLHYEVRNVNKHYSDSSNPRLNLKNYLLSTGNTFEVLWLVKNLLGRKRNEKVNE